MALNWEYREADDCFAAEGIAYCAKPLAPELQQMNIYIPAAYLDAEGHAAAGATLTTAHGASYTAESVPVVLYNDIGGYAECKPASLTPRNRRYLQDGYVLVSVGARGRQTHDAQGRACGKAPAALVDLKAAVRWLRAHASELPAGNLGKIVSVGTSAGGAMSSLLGVTGNADCYAAGLEEIGAEMDERDDIFAAQCYCPIIDLEHADMAYEWMYSAKHTHRVRPMLPLEVLDEFECELSHKLAAAYPAYINSLDMGVELGADGRSGSYYETLMGFVSSSLNDFLDRNAANEAERRAFVEEFDGGAGYIAYANGKACISDLDSFVRLFIGRMKGCPAFDPINAASPENEEFGRSGSEACAKGDKLHFSAATAAILHECAAAASAGVGIAVASSGESPEASAGSTAPAGATSAGAAPADAAAAYAADTQALNTPERVELINPLPFALGKRQGTIAPHFRIRLGSADADHSFSASFNLYCALKKRGIDVSYALIWGRGHCDADHPGQFSAWVDSIAGS